MDQLIGENAMVSSSVSSCGVIVQHKRSTHRPGGCVNVLFQLFNWNRIFAKKKRFPKKLLPPVRAPRSVSKKCSGDEKMPVAKFLLIAEENRGGFPSTKKSSEVGAFTRSSHDSVSDNAICAPSLVARLMGLESMPSLPQDKPRKAVDSAFLCDGSETSCSSRHDLDLQMGGRCKLETRPQKLQKIGGFNRQPVPPHLGSEVLPFSKTVMSRTRKQHHKLASPMKSQRFLGRKSPGRLMEAAVKILEPGLQQTNMSRCSLTYTDMSQNNTEEINVLHSSLKKSQQIAGRYGPPCRTYRTSVEAVDFTLKHEEPYGVEYPYSTASAGGTSSSSTNNIVELNKFKPPDCLKDGRKPSPAAPINLDIQMRSREQIDRRPMSARNGQNQRKANEEPSSRTISRQNNIRKNQMQLAQDRIATGSGVHSCKQRKDLRASKVSRNYLPLDKNTCSRGRTGTTLLPTSSVHVEKRTNTLSSKTPTPKRRSNNSSLTADMSTNKGISCSKHRIVQNEKIPVTGRNTRSTITSEARNLRKQVEDNGGNCTKNKGVVSFTFNASSSHESSSASSSEHLGGQMCQADDVQFNASHSEKSAKHSVGVNLSSRRVGAFNSDELSDLLEQKIEELNALQNGAKVSDEVGRSTTAILQELISVLTKGLPVTQENVDTYRDSFSQLEDQPDKSLDHSPVVDSQGCKSNKLESSCGTSISSYCDQPSPVSILEVSFSNESSLSESLSCNSASGSKSYFGLTEGSCSKSDDTDTSDSASFSDIRTERTVSLISLENISIMYNSFRGDNRFLQTIPSFIEEVITNTEMLLSGSVSSNDLEDEPGFSIGSLILDTLENLLHSLWNSSCNKVFPDAKDKGQFRRFLFDYMIEYLDTRYKCYCKCGYKLWEKLPSFLNNIEKLSREIFVDIRKCDDLDGKILDDIIEKEMSHSSGKWDDFGTEVFEEGIRIEDHILQTLVDETITNLF